MKTTQNFWNRPLASRNKVNRPLPAFWALGMAALLAAVQAATAAPYTWNVTSGNWSTTNNWSPNTTPGLGGPLPTDSVIFGNSEALATITVNNTVDLGFDGLITNLTYNADTVSPTLSYNVTQIPTGQTLTVSGNLLVGGVNGVSSDIISEAYMVGAGSLLVTATNLMVENYDNTTRAGATAYFNLSGLTNFVYNNSVGTIRIEDRLPSDTTDTGLGGNMSLAAVSNKIVAATLNLGTSSSAQAGAAGSLALGTGTNIIYASNINISSQKSTFTVSNTAVGAGLRIRGVTGADSDSSDNITLGNKNVGNSSGTITGSLLLNGCMVDIKAGTLIVGANIGGTPNTTANNGGVGVLQFDTGTISANSVIMADNTSPNNADGVQLAPCTGTIDVGANATLFIGAGQLFDLASETSSGPSTGTLIISNGLVNCQGPIAMGPHVGNACSGSIVFLSGGTLNMGPNSYVGVLSNAVTTLTLATNCVLSVSIPSVNYTNICVGTLNWPTPDTGMTISVAAMPAGLTNGSILPFLNYAAGINGTFNNPILSLPPGVTGYLSLAPGDDTIFLNITSQPLGGVNALQNPSFEQLPVGTNWTTVGGTSVITTNVSTTYPNTGSCTSDTRPVSVFNGTNTAKITGSFVAGGSTNSWSQSVSVTPGSTYDAGAFVYVAHEDIMSGQDSFYLEVDFKDINGGLLASYESAVLTNMTCGGPNVIPLDSWALMPLTNQMQVTGGINIGAVASNLTSVIITVPPQTATAQYKAVFIQRNGTDSGSVYFDSPVLGFLAPPVPPSVSAVSPNLITLCTNTALTCTATSTVTTISGVQIITQTTTLGGTVTNITTNIVGSAGVTVTGLGTSSANISFALATNTIYQSVVVNVTDANGITVASTPVSFDTLTPTLVIEASDFNYTSGSSGLFFDTPPNGGLALYQGQVGTQGIDENKSARFGEAVSYYRPSDYVIMQAAAPGTGTPPTGTEQKFVTAAANGDSTDIEVEVGYNTPGDWLNYTRTFGSGGSAPAGTYNVWCYLATSGSGVQASLSELTSDPTQPNQTTNYLGNFGTAAFNDGSYNSFYYVPLVNQFGIRVAVTVTNGEQTFKSAVVGNPNLGLYILTPVAPIYTPEFEQVYPSGPSEPTNQLTFTVTPEQGASISTDGIGVILNGVVINSGLSFTAGSGGSWTVDYPISSNEQYTVTITVTNTAGLGTSYSSSFDTFNLNNFHWMAVDYDFSTNNGTGTGGTVGDGRTGDLFIDNPVPTGDTNAPSGQSYQFLTNSYFGYPTAFFPGNDPAGQGAVAQQSIDIYWPTNATQDITGGYVTNTVYRGGPYPTITGGVSDGVAEQVAGDSFVLPEFTMERTNLPDAAICEFNIGYFYATNWLNYTRTYPAGTYNVWGRLGAGTAFNGATLSRVTSGVGTSNQVTSALGTFSDPSPAGYQSYHWIQLSDTNGNPVIVTLGGVATLRLTAPTNASPSGGALNPLFFMLAPATAQGTFSLSTSMVGGQLQISFPTQSGHSYSVISASSLSGSSWTQVGGNIPGNGEVFTVPIPVTANQGYYQVMAH